MKTSQLRVYPLILVSLLLLNCSNLIGGGDTPSSTTPPSTTLAAPTVTAAAASSSSIVVGWSSVSGAAGYNVYRSTAAAGSYTLISYLGSGTYTYADTGLSPSTTYYYKVAATSGSVEGTRSAYCSATTYAASSGLAAPTVTAAAASSSSIVVGWSSVSGAAGYNVYRSVSAEGTYTSIVTNLSSGTYTYPDTIGLSPSTTYYYKVAATNGSVEGTRSAYCSATTYAGVAVPVITSVGSATSASLTINWTAVTGTVNYTVYRDTSAAGSFGTVVASGLGGTTYTDTGLSPGTTYYYEVQATNGLSTSEKSSPVSGTTGAALPGTPSLSAVSQGTSTSTVSISWSAASGADSYNIYRYQGSSSSPTLAIKINVSPITALSYPDTGATYGYDYYYYVTAVNGGGESAKSGGLMGYLKMPTPTGLSASTVYSGYVYLSWTGVSRVSYYNIYRDGVLVSTSSIASYSDYPGNTLTHTYRVSAVGNSVYTRTASESAQSASSSGHAN